MKSMHCNNRMQGWPGKEKFGSFVQPKRMAVAVLRGAGYSSRCGRNVRWLRFQMCPDTGVYSKGLISQ